MRIACIFEQSRQDEELSVGQGERELAVKESRGRKEDGKFCPAPRESIDIMRSKGLGGLYLQFTPVHVWFYTCKCFCEWMTVK